jgi:hypothetical protein
LARSRYVAIKRVSRKLNSGKTYLAGTAGNVGATVNFGFTNPAPSRDFQSLLYKNNPYEINVYRQTDPHT